MLPKPRLSARSRLELFGDKAESQLAVASHAEILLARHASSLLAWETYSAAEVCFVQTIAVKHVFSYIF